MEFYRKPVILSGAAVRGIFPLAAIAGLSAAKLAVVGVAAALGLGAVSKGNAIINSAHTDALTARKDFSLA